MNLRLILACFLALAGCQSIPKLAFAEEFPAIAGPADIPAAESGITDFYYDPLSGGVHVSVGEVVLVLGIEGSPINLENRNNDSALGLFEQADGTGLAHLDYTGLPTGVHNLGNVLEPGLASPTEFSMRYEDFEFKSGAAGVPTHFSGVRVFGAPGIAYVGGSTTEPPVVEPPDPPEPPFVTPPPLPEPPNVPLPDVAQAQRGDADLYYDPQTGGVFVSVGEDVLVIGLEGAAFNLENRNEFSSLGRYEQADARGLGHINFSGLPTGVHNLGALFDPGFFTADAFSAEYENFVFRSGAAGVPEIREGVSILGTSEITVPPNPTPPVTPPVVEPPVVTPPPLPEPPNVPLPEVAEAQPGDADLYYDPATGGLFVSVGEEVLVIGIEGASFDLGKRNEFSALGVFEQADARGLGHLDFTGLPAGVHNLGEVLAPGFFTADDFSAEYANFVFRSGAAGVSEIREGLSILGTSEITTPPGPEPPVTDLPPPMFANEIEEAAPGEAQAYYDPATGEIFVSIGEGVLVLILEGAPLMLDNRNDETELGSFEQADAGGLAQLSFSGLPTGVFSLGALLPPGANSPEEFAALYDNFLFRSGAAGVSEIRSGIRILGPPSTIPEPSAGRLFSLFGIASFSRRRRT